MRCRRAWQAPAAAQRASSLLRDGIDERGLARLHAIQLVRRFLPAADARRGLVRSLGPCRGDCARSVARFATPLPQAARLRPGATAANKKPRHSLEPGVSCEDGLAVTYFRVRNAHYHRRKPVSRFCSGWQGVGPGCYGRPIDIAVLTPTR